MNIKNECLDYLQSTVSQEVHLRAINSLADFTDFERKTLLATCTDMLNAMIKEEHIKQYGRIIL